MDIAKLLVAGFLAIALATISGKVTAQGPGSPASAADLELGKKAYVAACLECHGAGGHGDGPKARQLGFHPRRFNLGAFKCRCTESGALPTDDDLYRVVTGGMPGTPMQPHEKTLSEADRRAVVQYIKSLAPRFASEPPPPCMRITAPLPSSESSILEGRQVYRILGCWNCHGKTGKGNGPAAAGLKDDWGNPIRAYDFTVMKRFKCGLEDVDIYRTLLTGMNGSPMPSYAAAFLFGRDSLSDMSPLRTAFSAAELSEFQAYLALQPDAASIKAMAPPVRDNLLDKRAWSLVHYLKSISVPDQGK